MLGTSAAFCEETRIEAWDDRMPPPGERANDGRLATARSAQAPLVGGFVLLVLVGMASVWFSIGSHRFGAAVSHSRQIRSAAFRLLTLVQDAETGERGYLLTGNEIYLRPYEVGSVEAPKSYTVLKTLLESQKEQPEALAKLGATVGAKLRDLALTISLKRAGNGDEALRHVNLNIGNDLMEDVRHQVAAIEGEEARGLTELTAAADFNNNLLAAVTVVGVAVIIALAAYSIDASRRATRNIVEAQDELRQTNENLELLVAERVAELQLANEEIQRFAYIVSHDLRAPLVNVMGFTSELDAVRGDIATFLDEVEKTAPQLVTADRKMAIETDLPEALGFIRTSTQKMDRLINAILKLSREGRRVLTPQQIDLRELVAAQGETLSQQLDAGRAELVVQPDLPGLVSDRLAVEQIFGNIIENATKYLSPGRPGRIEVTGATEGGVRRYDISDNGRGIEAKDFERVFELFRRSGEQDKPGEGIGLAYVRNLARRLGGNVAVSSEFGVGSTFTVTLPAVFQQKTRSSSPKSRA